MIAVRYQKPQLLFRISRSSDMCTPTTVKDDSTELLVADEAFFMRLRLLNRLPCFSPGW